MYRFKNNIQGFADHFRKKYKESKQKPRSKKKSFLLGFTTAISIFGITLFGPALPAVAKDLTNTSPRPSGGPPTSAPTSPGSSEEIIKGLAGAASVICGIAVTTGSFALGAACGLIVSIGVLKANGK